MQERRDAAGSPSGQPVVAAAPASVPVVALSFLSCAFLVFVLTPVVLLAIVLVRSDFFQDLPNSHLRDFAFAFITSPDDIGQTIQKFLTPAIGALLPAMCLKRGGSRAAMGGVVLVLAIAIAGFFLVSSFSYVFSSGDLQERLFAENAFALGPSNADVREAFDAKLATARGYLSRLQESLLFIVTTVLGIRLAGR
jgi:hypothetical protein